MYSPKVRKILLALLAIAWAVTLIYFIARSSKGRCPLSVPPNIERVDSGKKSQGYALLRARRDKEASAIFERILESQPQNIDALWGKAEVLRRAHAYNQAEAVLHKILTINPNHPASINSLAYIKYNENKIDESTKLVDQVLKTPCLDKEDEALAYLMLGAIYGKRSEQGWFLNKLTYGTKIQGLFLKAQALAPDLPETHLGLGTYYLKAPSIAGGNLDSAIKELELALKMAPDFASVNARLALAYKKSGDLKKCNIYLNKARELDPQNEFLKEIE